MLGTNHETKYTENEAEKKFCDVIDVPKSKAPGIDKLTSDVIKTGGDEAVYQLTKVYNKNLQSRRYHSYGKNQDNSTHKMEDKADFKNYIPLHQPTFS